MTYSDKIMAQITKLDSLQLLKCNYAVDSLRAVFFHHYDSRFYEITVKPLMEDDKHETYADKKRGLRTRDRGKE